MCVCVCVCLLLKAEDKAKCADVCWRMLTNADGVDTELSADVCRRMQTYADVCWRMLKYADIYWRMLTSWWKAYADVCWRMLTGGRKGAAWVDAEFSSAAVCTARAVRDPSGKSSIRMHTYSICQHMSAYFSMRPRTVRQECLCPHNPMDVRSYWCISVSDGAARLGKYAQNAGGEAAGTQFTCFTGTNTQFTWFTSRMQEEKQQVLSLLDLLVQTLSLLSLLVECSRRSSSLLALLVQNLSLLNLLY